MGLYQIINNIDKRYILKEESVTYTVGYERDGKEYSYNIKATSTSDAQNKFHDYMEANGTDRNEYTVKGTYQSTSDDDLEEANTTSNLDGGMGQPRIPHAFQRTSPSASDKAKEKKNATSSTGYDLATRTNKYFAKRNEMLSRADKVVNRIEEVRYKDYATDPTMSAKQKINASITEVNRRMYEIERMVDHASRLKTEVGIEDVFWKSTRGKFTKMSERMLRIGNKLREFNS
jgi:hypothetical protein